MQLDIFKPKAPPLFGMDISSSAVKMVELADAGKGAQRVERYAIESLAKDSVLDGNIANLESVAEAVRRAWKKLGTRTKNVAMALPTAAVITKKIVCPAGLREEDLEVQVEGEANQYIPFALDEVNLDFQVLGPAPSGPEEVEVLIAASRKEKVEDRVAVAEAAGLKALVMDVESYAMQTAFELIRQQLPSEGRDQNVAVVDLGASIMNITVLRNDQAVYTRELTMSSSPGSVEVPPVSRMWSIALNWGEVKKNCFARWISSAAFSMNGRSTSASKLSGSPPERLAFSASSEERP